LTEPLVEKDHLMGLLFVGMIQMDQMLLMMMVVVVRMKLLLAKWKVEF
jgi:hypothetical protein